MMVVVGECGCGIVAWAGCLPVAVPSLSNSGLISSLIFSTNYQTQNVPVKDVRGSSVVEIVSLCMW